MPMLASGEVVTSRHGRSLTPFPAVKGQSSRSLRNALAAIDIWLITNAIADAEAARDEFVATQFRHINPKFVSPADRDALNMYLFG